MVFLWRRRRDSKLQATPLAVPEQPVGRSALFLGLFRPLRQPLLPFSATGGGRIGCPRLSALGFELWLCEKKKPPEIGWFFFGGEGGTRTLAPVTRPTPLAGAPRHQLEYFSIGKRFYLLLPKYYTHIPNHCQYLFSKSKKDLAMPK